MCIAIAPNKSFINIPLINIYLTSEIKHDNFLSKKYISDHFLSL